MNIQQSDAKQVDSPFPQKITYIDDEINQQITRDCDGFVTEFIQLGEEKWVFPSQYLALHQDVYNFKPRADDTWIITFPRSGTTVAQELIWLVANDLDYELAAKSYLKERFPFLEVDMCINDIHFEKNNAKKRFVIDSLEAMEKPRFIKTHVPLSLLSPNLLTSGCKIVYVARNPKSVAVSYYNFYKHPEVRNFASSFEKFWNYFQNNLVVFSPYWKHLKEAWQLRTDPNVLFIFYEDIVKDMKSSIKRIAKFFNKSYNDDQISQLADHLNFENFKKNPSVNGEDIFGKNSKDPNFVRKGQVNGWSKEFTPELTIIADKWIAENLADTDFRFPE